jgi:FAD/FMN-containing dehydrogenase
MNQLRLNGAGKDPILLTTESLKSLGSHLRGRIVTAEDESFDKTRKVWNGLIDKKPGAIIQCLGTADVMAAVKFAGKHGLRISVRSGGHNVAGSCLDENGYVIDLSAMRGVRVDPENQIARAEGGARLGDLDHETQAFGQAAPVGVVSATGVAGLTLHGGVGWLLRRHGLSIDNLLSVDVVTADGQFRRADLDQNPDLFWAIRGGGGNFGVVTSFEFKIHSVGPEVWMSAPVYPLDRAAEVVAAFRDYMEAAPDELMGIAVYWSAPEAHVIPEKLRGSPVVILLSCYTGPLDEAEKITAPLRNIGAPIADLGGSMGFTDAQKFLKSKIASCRVLMGRTLIGFSQSRKNSTP